MNYPKRQISRNLPRYIPNSNALPYTTTSGIFTAWSCPKQQSLRTKFFKLNNNKIFLNRPFVTSMKLCFQSKTKSPFKNKYKKSKTARSARWSQISSELNMKYQIRKIIRNSNFKKRCWKHFTLTQTTESNGSFIEICLGD